MESRPGREWLLKLLIQLGLFVIIIFIVIYPREQSQNPFPQITPPPTRALTNAVIAAKPTFSGASVWILSCLDGWQRQKIYQKNPFYTNLQGIQRAKDIYVFGNFWLQPDTGTLWPYSDKPAVFRCLSDLITTVHSYYHAQVCGVIAVDGTGQETAKSWPGSEVAAYTQRSVAHPALLTPIIEQVKKYPYDCIINDIEDGYRAHPQLFSQYDALLRSQLPVVLGQTLLWKTPRVSAYWQMWQDWGTLANSADFFIIMVLDQDSLYNPPVPASVVNMEWVRQVYAYMRSVPHLFGSHPVAWELPTYYRLFSRQSNGSWAVAAGTDVQTQITIAVKGKKIRQNHEQDPKNAYLEYTNTKGQDTYLFFETAKSSDALAQLLTGLNQSTCLMASFWDNDSGTSNSLGWSTLISDKKVHLC